MLEAKAEVTLRPKFVFEAETRMSRLMLKILASWHHRLTKSIPVFQYAVNIICLLYIHLYVLC